MSSARCDGGIEKQQPQLHGDIYSSYAVATGRLIISALQERSACHLRIHQQRWVVVPRRQSSHSEASCAVRLISSTSAILREHSYTRWRAHTYCASPLRSASSSTIPFSLNQWYLLTWAHYGRPWKLSSCWQPSHLDCICTIVWNASEAWRCSCTCIDRAYVAWHCCWVRLSLSVFRQVMRTRCVAWLGKLWLKRSCMLSGHCTAF
mmetsp:Transcript_10802/g.24432  ORF Transcript_10802/g.24432 Transcript_10802/m.24432 type:complete len:206 (-) Transcript_10802:1993-2610(-)